jgi:hypothetical protein
MRGAPRTAALAAGLAAALASGAAGAGAAGDPALEALRARDAYVSPRVLGTAAPAEERVLAQSAAALREAGRPVKLAVVLGPTGAPSLPVYARRLAARLGARATVIVTRSGGPVVAVAPDGSTDPTARLRAGDVAAVANPVERLVVAARATAVPIAPEEGGGWTGLALLGLALAGGGWAAAVGVGRHARRDRRDLSEDRALARVHLDAVRARAIALARSPGLAPGARPRVEAALGAYAELVAALQEARGTAAVAALAPRIDAALEELAEAAAAAGAPFAPERPFEGLCATDPVHGPATARGPVAGGGEDEPVCAVCRSAADEGHPPRRRMLARGGLPVPFDEVAPAAAAPAGGPGPGTRASRG